MNQYIKIISIVTLFFVIYSCNVIDLDPVSSISTSSYWKTADDIEAARISCYDGLQGMLSTNYAIWGDMRSDAFSTILVSANATYEQLIKNALNPDIGGSDWTALYRTIGRCNSLIENISSVSEMSSQEMNVVIGEAKFIRALCYFYAVRLWGDVPLVLKPYTSSKDDFLVSRTPKADVIKQILADVNEAISVLPKAVSTKAYATLGAAYALQAHVYAWEHDYSNAATAAQEVIDMGYSLVTSNNYATIFSSENTTESIFELQFDYNNQETNGLAGIYLVNPYISGIYPRVYPSEKIIAMFNENDIRKSSCFGYSTVSNLPYVTKYMGTAGLSTYNVYDDNIIIFRLADIILLKAEMLAEMGEVEKAKELLNMIRVRANLNETDALNQSEIKKAILDERFFELYCEGQRWFDLVRTGEAVNEIESLTSEDQILWPINTNSIILNKNLEQNSYYK